MGTLAQPCWEGSLSAGAPKTRKKSYIFYIIFAFFILQIPPGPQAIQEQRRNTSVEVQEGKGNSFKKLFCCIVAKIATTNSQMTVFYFEER